LQSPSTESPRHQPPEPHTRPLHDALPISAVDRLAGRGLVEAGGDPEAPVFTDAGRKLREELERRTDELSVPAFAALGAEGTARLDRKSTRLNSSHVKISYAVFCVKTKSR